MDDKAAQRIIQNYRKHLKALAVACDEAIRLLDAEMKQPSTVERGKRIADICNGLELAKDQARHFGLGEPLT